MNTTTTLQVPISSTLKSSATAVARDYGFSSLQEIVRVLLTKLANRQLTISVGEQFPAVKLSEGNEKRYLKMDEDFKKGKNVKSFSGVKQLMKDLRS